MLGKKLSEDKSQRRIDQEAWPWVYPTYTTKISRKSEDILTLEIDPTQRMADIDRKNNKVEVALVRVFENSTK
jgi:hypothetical protein